MIDDDNLVVINIKSYSSILNTRIEFSYFQGADWWSREKYNRKNQAPEFWSLGILLSGQLPGDSEIIGVQWEYLDWLFRRPL